MRKFTFYLVMLCAIIHFTACKKCVTCSNKCYKCGSSGTMTCSDGFVTQASWESVEEVIKNTNGCSLAEPTENLEVCDNNIKNIIKLYEKENYYCH